MHHLLLLRWKLQKLCFTHDSDHRWLTWQSRFLQKRNFYPHTQRYIIRHWILSLCTKRVRVFRVGNLLSYHSKRSRSRSFEWKTFPRFSFVKSEPSGMSETTLMSRDRNFTFYRYLLWFTRTDTMLFWHTVSVYHWPKPVPGIEWLETRSGTPYTLSLVSGLGSHLSCDRCREHETTGSSTRPRSVWS